MLGMGTRNVYDLVDEKQLRHVVEQATGSEEWQVTEHHTKPASEGLSGFLGDHFRVTLQLQRKDQVKKVHLFVKSMPILNGVKAKFIDENNFFRRETLMFQLFDELGGADGATPWHAKAYLHNDRIIVMPDLALQGYAPQPYYETLDLAHILVVTASTARLHAAYTNYATKRTSNGQRFNILDQHKEVLGEPNFCDTPWMHACAKATTSLLKAFSTKYKDTPNLEENILKMNLKACDTLRDYTETLNVMLHRDLWANNIMFRHDNGEPVNAVLVDYQCVRYGPPAFDIAMLLYLNTTLSFREQHEEEVLRHYFLIFWDCLEESAKSELRDIGYGYEELLLWFEKGRMFGMMFALAIFPYVLMEPVAAARVYDDPATYERYLNVDRSEPVLEQCRRSEHYRVRQLELGEEFVQSFVVDKL